MKIILTGATGFTGGEVLRQALADPEIAQVTVLTRRELEWKHPKLHTVVLEDFEDYSKLELSDHAACIWCLGVSQAQAGKDEYTRITLDYAVAAAKAMYASNPQMKFCFVSGRSADPTEQRSSLQAKIKGRTERKLAELGGLLFVFRPGYIRPTARTGPRKDFARLLAPIGAIFSLFGEDYSVDCDKLAYCLLDVAKYGADHTLLVNREFLNWKSGRVQ
jgi:uncharacterized protein YbjT (DUF2867 family)